MTTSNEERPRVLIVDDEKFIRDILADFLGMEGYVVRTAEDGQAALNELTNAHYDLVISDVRLPGVTGISVLEALRHGNARGRRSTPVLLMTAFGDERTHAEAERLGAVLFDKPFDLDEFLDFASTLVLPRSA